MAEAELGFRHERKKTTATAKGVWFGYLGALLLAIVYC